MFRLDLFKRERSKMKKYSPLIFSIIMILSGFLNALALVHQIRLVDVLILFFSGVGAGAGLVKTITDVRLERRTKVQADDLT
jgi:hypothetical protein